MFVVLEGIDGCGKSTQATLLAEWLRKKGEKVVLTAEPTKGEIGKFIRTILAGHVEVDPKTLALLFTADRYENLDKIVEPALKRKEIVISERYHYSTIAYQAAQGINMDWLVNMNVFARVPDLAIFLDVKPEISVKKTKTEEIFENEEFLKKVYENYFNFNDLVRIDGNRPVEDVFENIKTLVTKKM